jgi:hypothetical protein
MPAEVDDGSDPGSRQRGQLTLQRGRWAPQAKKRALPADNMAGPAPAPAPAPAASAVAAGAPHPRGPAPAVPVTRGTGPTRRCATARQPVFVHVGLVDTIVLKTAGLVFRARYPCNLPLHLPFCSFWILTVRFSTCHSCYLPRHLQRCECEDDVSVATSDGEA